MPSRPLLDAAPLPHPRVLVVDDDAHLRRLLQDVLALEGLQVQTAADVPGAEAILAVEEPDLIVLDIMLPGQSGLDFCRGLAQRTPPIPVLFLSARGTADDKVAGLAEGAVDYLAKPFDPAELVARCRAALRTQQRARASAQSALVQFQSEVLGLIGHELRTPLSLVLGYAELLQARGESLTAERSAEFLQEIAVGSHRLARMLEDVLLVVSHPPPHEPLDLRALIDRAVNDCASTFESHDVALLRRGAKTPLPMRGAESLLCAALRHLLENAAVFSASGATVDLSTRVVGDRVQIAVRDHGPGIADTEQERIFDRFYQSSRGATRTHGGLGLGLAIVRRAAEDHHGEIQVASTVGAGSTFTLVLPLTVATDPSG